MEERRVVLRRSDDDIRHTLAQLAQDVARIKAKQHEIEERLTTTEHVMDRTYQSLTELRSTLVHR